VDDLGPKAATPEGLRRHLEQNPIEAWTGGKGTGGTAYFAYQNGVLRTTFNTEPADRAVLQELARELADWRLAEYVDRLERQPASEASYLCKVSHAGGRPILFLPSRAQNPGLPSGPTPVQIDDTAYEADFVKVALNVVRLPGDARNRLPEILRGWFGPDAGLPGTRHEVVLDQGDDAWRLRPANRAETGLQLWRRYPREQIPPLFGLPFSVAIWNAGFVVRPGHVFLLVTLDKSGKSSDFQYKDRFLSPTLFQWESQNRTRRDDTHGRLISGHKAQGIPIHLFVRKTSRIAGGGPAPFVYCGDVEFVDWEGESPITVQWKLPEPVPERLLGELVPARKA
jgi:hypothetical protein